MSNLTVKSYTIEKVFKFDSKTKTIKDYNELIGGNTVSIPPEIRGVPVERIAEKAFSGKRLHFVSIPKSVEVIEAYAFSNNEIESVCFEDGLISIGDYAFYKNKIGSLKFPSTLREIGKNAFANCLIFGELVLPNSIKTIDSFAFVNNFISHVRVMGDIDLKGEGKIFKNNKIDKVVFGSKVKRVAPYMFFGCLLKSIEFNKSINTIGHHAFSNNKLTEVCLPSSIQRIEDYAFASNEMTELIIPESVTNLGRNILWIQGVQVDNSCMTKCEVTNDKLIINVNKINPNIDMDRIVDPIWQIRNTSYDANLNKAKGVIEIQLCKEKKNYIETNKKDCFSIMFDYEIGNEKLKSGGCNSVSWVFKLEEILN